MDIHPITADDFAAFVWAGEAAFGSQATNEEIEAERLTFEFDRSLAAFDNGRIVGTAGAYSFDLTLPGLTTTPVAGVTWVSVLPTHRRQGILRSLMRRQLDDVRERGEALAILLASESVIYGRFGYGLATSALAFDLDPRHAAFTRPLDPAGSPAGESGRCRLIDRAEAGHVLPEVFDRARLLQPGEVNRSPARWEALLRDAESEREGASARFYVVYAAPAGQDEGYAVYRVREQWNEGIPNHTVLLHELIATTPRAHAALWRYCLNIDLVTTVHAMNCPVDETLRWMLADPRRMRVTRLSDRLWARVVDVPAALAARRYGADGRLVLDLADSFCPDNTGRYELEGGPAGATCCRTNAEADLALGASELGAMLLGGVRPGALARAGRVSELASGALARADLMFPCAPAPWCATFF